MLEFHCSDSVKDQVFYIKYGQGKIADQHPHDP